MHQGPAEAKTLTERLQEKVTPHTHVTNVLCPPFVSLPAVAETADSDVFKVGAQNLNEQDEGAFTGEVSGSMLKGLAEYVIAGHSERRREFHETDKQIAAKVAAGVRNGLKVILCVGEKLDERHDGHSTRVVVDQLHGALSQVTDEDLVNIVVAYEPVWAIGTGEFAKPEEVTPIVSVIRQTVEELFGESASSRLQILYGGSVDAGNARSYLELDHVSGLLVGGASLKADEFTGIIGAAQELAQ